MDADTIAKYRQWRQSHDEGYCYDEICDWADGELSRGELLRILDEAAGITEKSEGGDTREGADAHDY